MDRENEEKREKPVRRPYVRPRVHTERTVFSRGSHCGQCVDEGSGLQSADLGLGCSTNPSGAS
ncbi:MAG: hypothetical protein HY608_11930 [Planctomycetes bacterium]|nr:hypothetical protein [Planctomycetota bacterium]